MYVIYLGAQYMRRIGPTIHQSPCLSSSVFCQGLCVIAMISIQVELCDQWNVSQNTVSYLQATVPGDMPSLHLFAGEEPFKVLEYDRH